MSSWQGDTAELIISVSGASRYAYYSSDNTDDHNNLNHKVTLTRGKETRNFTFNVGEPLVAEVSPGNWNVRVDSYLEDTVYATGSKPVVLKSGQNYEEIPMENAIEIFFNANEGFGSINPIVIKVNGGSITLPDGSKFSRDGYTFGGWKFDNDEETYRAGFIYTNNTENKNNITVCAQWVSNSSNTRWITVDVSNIFGDNGSIKSIAWGNDKFVAGGLYKNENEEGEESSSGKMVYSEDGIKWIPINYYISSSIRGIAWGEGRFVAISENGEIIWSYNGIEWDAIKDSPFQIFNGNIAWGNNNFVAVDVSKIVYSNDGKNWTPVEESAGFLNIAWGNNKFVAVGNEGKNAYSSDGINWTNVPDILFSGSLLNIAWGKDKFVVGCSKGRILYSYTGY